MNGLRTGITDRKAMQNCAIIIFCCNSFDTGFVLKDLIKDYKIIRVSTVNELKNKINTNPKCIIISDLILKENRFIFFEAFKEILSDKKFSIKVIFVSNEDSFEVRLASIRNQGDFLIRYPDDRYKLTGIIDSISDSTWIDPPRVLIIDKDNQFSKRLLQPLESTKIIFKVITDFSILQDTLNSFSPELLFLWDSYSKISGMELSKIITQLNGSIGVPIVFLSKKSNGAVRDQYNYQSFETLFFEETHSSVLIKLIKERVDTYRSLRLPGIRDGLTGLLNQTMIEVQIEIEINRAKRNKAPLSFVMIDIDNFKSVNDTFGHIMGDAVLKKLAKLLKGRLRKSDVVGRMGGDEFGVILSGTTKKSSSIILSEIKETFSKIPFKCLNTTFYCSFSYGQSEFPEYGDTESILKSSDKNLRVFKLKK